MVVVLSGSHFVRSQPELGRNVGHKPRGDGYQLCNSVWGSLEVANLWDANLNKTDLSKVNLKKAILTGATLDEANLEDLTLPDGKKKGLRTRLKKYTG